MFWKKKPAKEEKTAKGEKLPRPTDIAEQVGRYLVVEKKRDPDWVWKLKSVVRQRPEEKKRFDVRVFDKAQATANKVTVKDYTSLDEHPDLILYEGWFDKESQKTQLEEGGQ
jgi:hypothetical protein